MGFDETPSRQIRMKRAARRIATNAGVSFWESIADITKVFFQYAKRHPFWGGVWFVAHLWVYSLAFYHIKDAVQLTRDFGEIVKALSPF